MLPTDRQTDRQTNT